MANALKFHTVVKGKKLTLADLDAFEGKRVEVTVTEDEGTSGYPQLEESEGRHAEQTPENGSFFGCFSHLSWTVPDDFDAPSQEIAELFEG